VLVWGATIYYLSSLPGPEIEKLALTFWDKGEHFVAFFSGAVALVLAMRWSTRMAWLPLMLLAYATLNAYGMFDEIHQTFTPNRSGADLFDLLADALGAAAGVIITSSVYVFVERKYPPAPSAD
jgi:VanZ family protein